MDLAREPFAGWWSGELTGRLDLDGSVEGTFAEPHLGGRIDASELRLGDSVLGDRGAAGLELSWRSGRVAALGSILGLVEVGGGGRLDDEALDLDLAVEAPDLPSLARLYGFLAGLEFGGSGAGRLRVTGRPGVDEPWRTGLRLDRLDLEHSGHRLSAARPVELTLTPEKVVVKSLYLVEAVTGNDIYLTGDIGLAEGAPVDLRLLSSVDSSLAAPLLPEFELSGGRFDLLAVIGGSLEAMRINGQGEVDGARVVLGELPPLESTRGLVLFYPDQVVLDSVRGEFGGGELRVGGTVDLPVSGEDPEYAVQIQGQQVTLRYPEGWEIRGDGDLAVVSLEEGRQQLRGSVTLDRALYLRRVEVGLTQLLQSLFQRRRLEVESTDEELSSTLLNLAISGPGALRVRNNVANLRGDVDLALRGSLAVPVLFGRLELEAGGTVQVGGSDYTVERGSLTFANPYRMEPVIDLAAKTRRRDYDLSLNLSGTLERLNASLASDPPLADLDVLGLLATGEPAAIEGPAQGAEAFLYGQAASLVTERVNRLFDLDRFRIDPLTGSSGSLSSARVTVGKQLSRDVLATYSYDPSLTEQQILQLEWSVARGLTLVVTQNGDGTYAVDSRWEKSF
ncbi:MAG: translocation/assembly module TamB domain-containing protein [Thermoanaerobaculia bacterium]